MPKTLRELLADYGLNVHQASQLSNILPPQVYRWADRPGERQTPTLESMEKLSRGTGIALEEIVNVFREEILAELQEIEPGENEPCEVVSTYSEDPDPVDILLRVVEGVEGEGEK